MHILEATHSRLTLLPFVLEHYYGLSELVTGLLMGAIQRPTTGASCDSRWFSRVVETSVEARLRSKVFWKATGDV